MRRPPPSTASAYGETDDTPKQGPLGLDERDQRLEARYLHDKRGERSTMAFVDSYRDELVAEFFDWRRKMTADGMWMGEGVMDALRRWERSRFGADLDAGCHGLLSFAVRSKLSLADGGIYIPAGYFDKPQHLAKPLPRTNAATLAAKAVHGMEMPKPPSRAEVDRQRREVLTETEEP